MTTLTFRLLLGAAMSLALLGGCNKRPADQPPTPSVTTPATPSDTTTPAPAPATTPPAQNSSAPPPTTNQ
ncbi:MULTISPECIES: hypothetical protein [unclassified Duganella]|uniref:hypothetical protein n=1 Tax=unclassified Duganella TaxID=2636909 RepID=UPI0008736900|nr:MULTISPECIES: hypothetical protein [unclassified Duganella]OEZ57546.1 hypothetical protein DUGA6_44450 [Duganella sp. HH105]OEZ97565.1 hypothetical protein DUGA2_59040 [Duganella sp. HH101]